MKIRTAILLSFCVPWLPLLASAVDFQTEIAPILEEHCLHCHGKDEQESGFRLDLRSSMLRGGDYGNPGIVPGDPEKSYLIELVKHLDPDLPMPPDEDRIPNQQIELLERWIEEGAVWPGQMEEVAEERSDHWSFQPIVRPPVPDVDTSNAIDSFLRTRLHADDLAYSEPANPRTLIRRVSIVLTGLAATPEQTEEFVDAFTRDGDAAYAKLVDRLMESLHFGQRWAQHWLDVIRWAETNGSESNLYRKNAWVYRDYVIRALNEDKPYDQFIKEQIAGDTMEMGEAMGYLVSGPHVPLATVGREPSARRQARADRMDEVLQTVGASVMGVTIGCARCHNHKFDPISIRDYYSMSAVFQDIEFGSRVPELPKDHPKQVRQQQLDQEIAEYRQQLREQGPWDENWTGYGQIHFPATTTASLRITFLKSFVRVDELEVFGPENPQVNFALASMKTKTKASDVMTVLRSELSNINDGEFGNDAWAGKSPKDSQEKPWVEFTFVKPRKINRVQLSSRREDFLETDYLDKLDRFHFSKYKVEVRDEEGNWKTIASTAQMRNAVKIHDSRASLLSDLKKTIAKRIDEGSQVSFVAKRVSPSATHVLSRGSPENPREKVFAAGLKELEGQLNLEPDAPGYERRVAFANWLTRPDHPLTPRVAANRIWHHVFGQGIVRTTADFGIAGAKPSHPELLDWLASELMEPESGKPWSMKHLIRMMVTSQAFRQSNVPQPQALAIDADSALLWRFPPRRATAEVIRDSVLLASGSLDETMSGRSYRIHNVKKRYAQWEVIDNHGPHTWRRMIYQERMRRVDDRLFTAFDFPDCGQVQSKRPVSTTPLQALNLLNSEFILNQSKRIADRAVKESDGDLTQSIKRCFELLLSRDPTAEEKTWCLQVANKHNLSMVCRAIVNSNEFVFLP